MLDPKFKINEEMAIKRMLAVALHIRDSERCRRIYSATFEASMEAKPEVHGGIWEYYPPHSYAY